MRIIVNNSNQNQTFVVNDVNEQFVKIIKLIETIIQDDPECTYEINYSPANETNTKTGIINFAINFLSQSSLPLNISVFDNQIVFFEADTAINFFDVSRANIKRLVKAFLIDADTFDTTLSKYNIKYNIICISINRTTR